MFLVKNRRLSLSTTIPILLLVFWSTAVSCLVDPALGSIGEYWSSHENSTHWNAQGDHLTKRTLSYKDAIAKGREMLKLLNNPPHCSSDMQSKWTNYADLAANGWTKASDVYRAIPDSGAWRAAQILGIPTDDGPDHGGNRMIDWEHPRTTAHYLQSFNIDKGAIICGVLWSPSGRGFTGDAAPKLGRWSDVTILQWQELTHGTGKLENLRYTVHSNVASPETQQIIEDVTDGQLDGVGAIHEFERGAEKFDALLGTPNAVGTAFLLAQHKEQLGWKTVKGIGVFTWDDEYTMILEIEPHPQAAASGNERREVGGAGDNVTGFGECDFWSRL